MALHACRIRAELFSVSLAVSGDECTLGNSPAFAASAASASDGPVQQTEERQHRQRGHSGVLSMRALILCCAIALGSGVLAASDPPAPAKRAGSKQQQPKPGEPASSGAPEPRGTASAPVFIQSIPSPDSASDAAHKEYEHHEKPTLDRWLTYSTFALAIATTLLFGFTALLWLVTLQLSRRAKKDGERQAGETKDALAISRESASAAIATERAYVFPDEIIVESDSVVNSTGEDTRIKRHINFRVRLRNHGKTPAALTEVLVEVKAIKDFLTLEAMTSVPLKSRFISAPDYEPLEMVTSEVPEDDYQLARIGELKLLCLGAIYYLDAFKQVRRTLFSWEYDFSARKFRPSVDTKGNDWT